MNDKPCCICRAQFTPNDENGETRQCCLECRCVMNQERPQVRTKDVDKMLGIFDSFIKNNEI